MPCCPVSRLGAKVQGIQSGNVQVPPQPTGSVQHPLSTDFSNTRSPVSGGSNISPGVHAFGSEGMEARFVSHKGCCNIWCDVRLYPTTLESAHHDDHAVAIVCPRGPQNSWISARLSKGSGVRSQNVIIVDDVVDCWSAEKIVMICCFVVPSPRGVGTAGCDVGAVKGARRVVEEDDCDAECLI